MRGYFKFVRKASIFSLPIFALLILPFCTILFGREYYSIQQIISTQQKNLGALFNLCCSNIRREYKENLFRTKNPEIIALGTSRVLQLRSEFFRNSTNFTNLGQAIIGTGDIEKFGKSFLTTSSVKFVLLGLDYQMFNPAFVSPDLSTVYQKNTFGRFFSILATNWRRVYSFYFQKKFTLSWLYAQFEQTNNVGLIAMTTNAGFRGDGSFEYGDELRSSSHAGISKKQMKESAASVRSSGQYGGSISQTSLSSIQKFLELCRRNNVEVIGFMAPQSTFIREALLSKNDNFKQSFTELPVTLTELFKESGFVFYDTSNAKETLGSSNDEFVDPLHGSDKMYLRIAIYLANHNTELKQYFDVPRLLEKLKNTTGNYLEYP